MTEPPPSRYERWLYGSIRVGLVSFARAWFGVRAEGLEHVPADRPFILAPVHRSNVDFLLVLILARRRMRFLGKDTIWKPWWFRWLADGLGGIPVVRERVDREALHRCAAVIHAGEPLVIFPEGTRQEGPEVQPCFDGVAYLQTRTGAPILPVGIGGSSLAMPRGSRLIRRTPVRLVVGPPLEAPLTDGPRARRSAIRARTLELRTVLQNLFDRAEAQAAAVRNARISSSP